MNEFEKKRSQSERLIAAFEWLSEDERKAFEDMRLHEELKNKTWRPEPYREFECRTEVKRRLINAPTFRDRIVQTAVYRVVAPLFEQKYIYDSYACRKGKGSHMAVKRTQEFLQRAARQYERVYVLQGDISKYYPSIYQPYLMEKMARTIRDKNVLWLLDEIYYGFSHCDHGIPIGAVTSQMAANVNLDTLDHFVKECIGAKFYLRYMDDFVIVAASKEELRGILKDIKWMVETTLHLKLNPKTRIYPASQGVDFAGYRIWKTHILPRKRNIKAAKIRFKDLSHQYKYNRIKLEDIRPRVASFLGYIKHCDAHKTTISTIKWLKLQRGGNNK